MGQTAAIFDVDGTLVRGSCERLFFHYIWRQGRLSAGRAAGFLWRLAWRPRGRFQDKSYLRGQEVGDIGALARRCYHEVIAPRLSRRGLAVLRSHQAQGHILVLLTGTLACLAEPLQEDLGVPWLIAARLAAHNGRFIGRVAGLHPRGANKAILLQRLAADQDLDLEKSFVYADGLEDADLLILVGRPVVVNPGRSLYRLARRQGWGTAVF